jgi:hypothetical protein
MKNQIIKALLLMTAVTLSTAASADTRIIEVWNCKLLDGKTIEQVQSADTAWLTFVNSKVQGAGVRAYAMTSVVGDYTGFLSADSYPSMAAWVEAKAALKTPEGQAVDAAWSSVAECTSNTLYESTES